MSPDNWDYTDWQDSSTFIDQIGQMGYVQSPAVYFDNSAPPYTGNTVYFMGAHTFNAGSSRTGYGLLVYNGFIRYYSDHGGESLKKGQTMSLLRVSFCAAVLAACSTAWAGKWVPVPVEALGQSADLVVLAVANVLPNSAGGPAMQFTVENWIGGQPGAATLIAAVPPNSPNGSTSSLILTRLIGRRGIWFVARVASGTGCQLLSMISGAYGSTDLFLPVSASVDAQQFPGTLNQQLLAYLVNWYQSLAQPTPVDDVRLLASFQSWRPIVQSVDRLVLLTAAAPLSGSVVVSQHLIGLVISLGLGSDAALSTVAAELGTLGSNPKFPLINETIAAYPHDSAAIPILASLASLHSTVTGLDDSVATALARISTKAVVPVMVTILDGQYPQAQLRAAAFLATYALFADAQGNLSGGSPDGPFATSQTRQNTPSANSGLTAAAYASFWKAWWASNQAALGFGN